MLDDRLMFGPYEAPPAHVAEEFGLLMSLALDDMLDDAERAAFDGYLVRYPVLADEWFQWQELSAQLHDTPSVLPPPSFMASFELRLVQQERRLRLWWGVGFAAVVMLLSVGIVVGAVSLGAFVVFRQPDWLTQLVHTLAYGYATVAGGLEMLGAALASVAASEQMRMLAVVYALSSAALLAGWVLFLRRTTRIAPVAIDGAAAA